MAWVLAACIAGAGARQAGPAEARFPARAPAAAGRPEDAPWGGGRDARRRGGGRPRRSARPDGSRDQYDRFTCDAPVSEGTPASADLRQRLTSVSSNGRLDYWGVAIDEFEASKLEGQGGGTFQIAWERERDFPGTVVDAHGLYPETLGELGLVGLVLLATALLAILVGLAVRIRGERPDPVCGPVRRRARLGPRARPSTGTGRCRW